VAGVLIDLHTHSTVSDGTQPPAEVVASAAGAGIDVLALTDHDSTAGWGEASEAAQRLGLTFVPGMEVSCSRDGISIHLLSYLHDPRDPRLAATVEAARDSREQRAERMVELLAQDVDITWESVLEHVEPGATIGRPHIADALVARGVVADRTDAFSRLLGADGPYYVRHYAPDPVEAVGLVLGAGGVPVMAHPAASSRGRVVDDAVIEELVDAGLAGLEVDHRDHTPAERAHLHGLAQRWGLLETGSSDYHGDGKPNRLGECTTAPDVFDAILARASGTPVVR
jgi:predicted metal-dependent phosphoesterase TrpH